MEKRTYIPRCEPSVHNSCNFLYTLLQQTLRAFYWLRDLSGIQKKPSTSEVLDWIQALQLSGIDPQRIADEIPYAGVLLKKNEDLDVLHRAKG